MKRIVLLPLFALLFASANSFADVEAGQKLFKSGGKCKNCHKTTSKKKVGPGLAGVTKRTSEKWLKAWLKDPKAVWTADKGYTKTLKKFMKKEGKPKPSHKTRQLSDQEIADLIDYLKSL